MVIGLIIQVIAKPYGVQQESDLFIVSVITDRIRRQEVQLPINPKNYNFWKNKNSRVKKEEICL